MTALKITKRAKIAGLASMTLAATSLTVLFASHSALVSAAPRGHQPTTTPTATVSLTTTPSPSPTWTCMNTPTATPTTVTSPPTTPAPTPTPTTPAPTPTAGANAGDRFPSSDGLTCRKPMTAGGRAAGQGASADWAEPLPEPFRQRLLPLCRPLAERVRRLASADSAVGYEQYVVPPVSVSAAQAAKLPQATTYATIPAAPADPARFAVTNGLVVHPTVAQVVYAGPGKAPVAVLPATELGAPTWVPVVRTGAGWDQVLLPSRPDHITGWIYPQARNSTPATRRICCG